MQYTCICFCSATMFYGAIVLSKKGPLAKVWLAAHWDKKLTKAQVFEIDVESTVDSIMSPQMKLELRTSGHLLLGVVRIYSRKQKYLLHDLGETCAKLKMAFRPGIVDLPLSDGAAEAITLPEIFHDFEDTVNLELIEFEPRFTLHPSRLSEITIAEDTGSDIFDDDNFEHGMEDIEGPRERRGASTLEVSGMDVSKAADQVDKVPLPIDEGLFDAVNDFGGDGIFSVDGFGGNLELPVPDPEANDCQLGVEGMEVDPLLQTDDNTSANHTEEEGFILEPVERTCMGKQVKKKRKLLVDAVTGEQIGIQFNDFKNLLQPKRFAPRTKKAVKWKEMARSDKLFSSPTVFLLGPELRDLITQKYSVDIPDEPAVIENMPVEDVLEEDSSNATLQDCVEPAVPEKMLRGESDSDVGCPGEEQPEDTKAIPDMPNLDEQQSTEDNSFDIDGCMDCSGGEQTEDTPAAVPKAIPPNIDEQQSTEEQESNKEFELRQWPRKKTYQVLGVLQKELPTTVNVYFSSLAANCNRRQAVSRFYACLVLAKDGVIAVTQPEPYADIKLQKGPKFST